MRRHGALLVIMACAAVALTACKDDSSPTPGTPVPATGVAPASDLAASFAPLVHLGVGEKNPPMDASTFIAGSKLLWVQRRPCRDNLVAEHPVEQDLANGVYQHRASNSVCKDTGPTYNTKQNTRPYGNPDLGEQGFVLTPYEKALRERGNTNAPVYVQRVIGQGANQGKKAYVYWLFYPFNDFPAKSFGDHEGDWERITVATDAADKPVRVVFSHHTSRCAVAWDTAEKQDGHPVVYSATGAHGSYPERGTYDGPAPVIDDHAEGTEPTWRTWADVREVDRQKWWGYAGGWGDRGADLSVDGKRPIPQGDMTGPAGPNPGRAKDMEAEAFAENPCPPPKDKPATTTTTPPASTSAAPAKTTAGAIQRMEQFLHATGKGDLKTMCEIAAPAMKQAAQEGAGSCESAFTTMRGMISGDQKAALREATIDPAKVSTHGGQVEIPASAVRAKEKFTANDLGDFTLEYRGDNWYIVD